MKKTTVFALAASLLLPGYAAFAQGYGYDRGYSRGYDRDYERAYDSGYGNGYGGYDDYSARRERRMPNGNANKNAYERMMQSTNGARAKAQEYEEQQEAQDSVPDSHYTDAGYGEGNGYANEEYANGGYDAYGDAGVEYREEDRREQQPYSKNAMAYEQMMGTYKPETQEPQDASVNRFSNTHDVFAGADDVKERRQQERDAARGYDSSFRPVSRTGRNQ